MAKAEQEKDERRTQIVVAIIAAAGIIVVAVLGLIGTVWSNKSNGQGQEESAISTTVYVTSVSTTDGGLSPGSVVWRFTGVVKPPPADRGAIFVLGKTLDGSKSLNSEPVPIASDGTWVAVVGPIPRDFAWKMKWIAAYGELLVNDADPGEEVRARRYSAPRDPRLSDPGDPGNPRDSEFGGGFQPEAVTEIPNKMLPPQTP